MALGKISGPLLKENLLRDGVDLAFETDLLYIDVNNRRVGIKTNAPTHDLTVNGTTRTTNLEVTTLATLGNVVLDGNRIYSNTGILEFNPPTGGQVVYQNKLLVDSIEISQNRISTIDSNANLEFMANGTGTINLNSNTEVFGNLHATGTITADGDLQIGDADTDNVVFNAEVASDILPDINNTYQLGSATKRWADVWVGSLNAGSVTTGEITVDGIDIALRQGNIFYVATNGDDGNSGTHQNDPLSSIGRALDLATAGDTIYIYPGTYSETMPLIVPAGVTVKGAGIRSVTIQPDSDVTVDVFLLNGETTIEDLTVSGFEFDAGTNTGYAFRFAPGMTVTSRSPYIKNVTVTTAGSTVRLSTNPVDDPRGFLAGDAGKGVYLDGSIVNASSKEASMLFHSVTFICPGVDAVTAINGVRIEWLSCFTYFADRGLYLLGGTSGFASDGKTRIKIINTTGTFNVGNTLTYYDTDGTTVLASGVIESIDGDFFVIDGKVPGFETLTDRDPKTVTVNGNAKLKTAVKKFGVSSLRLDGVNSYLSLASQPDFGYDTSDFTLEFFWQPDALGTQQVLFDQRTAATDVALYLEMNTAGNIRLFVNGSYRITSSVACTAGAMNHIVLFRTSGTTKLSVNGTITPTTYLDANNYAARPIILGANRVASQLCTGYIDEFRLVKGVTKYISSVTVPTSVFKGDTSTVLLLHFEGTNDSTVIVDDGVTLQDIRTSAGGTASIINFADYSDFGVEVRSIGSACVYGNYGVYGDGAGVLGYLIGQNFAYIGSGRLSDNDPIIIPNDSTNVAEVVQFNDAKIYYTSVDNKGDFKVGDFFVVDQENGTITFAPESLTIASSTGVVFSNGVNTTTIVPTYIETGNIKISGNTIESISGGITLAPANNQVTNTGNITITGDTTLNQNLTVQGNSVLGNSASDTTTFNSYINSYITPATTGLYDLGSSTNNWRNVWLSSAFIDDIKISGNLITTTVSNSNLELRANGTGIVNIQGNTVVNSNLTVSGTTSLQNTTVTGTLNSTDLITGTITVSSTANIDSIEISNNYIRTTVSNANLELRANGTGIVNIQDSAVVDNNLTVSGSTSLQNTTVTGTLNSTDLVASSITVSSSANIDSIEINNNYIRTTSSNANLELRANGTGIVNIQDSAVVDNNLTVNGTTSLQNTNITGTLNSTDLVASSITVSSSANIDSIEINDNYIRTTSSNANLELRANGTGIVNIQDSAVVDNNLTVNGTTSLQNTTVTGSLSATNLTVNNPIVASTFNTGDIQISGNVIRTTQSNSNLELRANGTGSVIFENFNVQQSTISNIVPGQTIDITPSGTGIVRINTDQALRIPVGTDAERPVSPLSGMIRFNSTINAYEGYNGTYWIPFGGITDLNRDTYIIPELSPGSNENTLYFYAGGSLAATLNSTEFNVNKLSIDNIEIDGNIIRTSSSNANLELRPNGTGAVVIDGFRITTNTITNTNSGAVTEFRSTGSGYYHIVGTNAVVIPSGLISERPGSPQLGMMRFNTELELVEIYNGLTWGTVAGTGSGITAATAQDIAVSSALIFG
jgi:hypothetical protein